MHWIAQSNLAMKPEHPIEDIWRIREELAAEEGCDVHTVFEILRREEKKHGDRVRPLPEKLAGESLRLREEPPKPE
jgi:rubrerythrin